MMTHEQHCYQEQVKQFMADSIKEDALVAAYVERFRKLPKEEQQNTVTYLTSIMEGWNAKPLKEQVFDELIRADGDYIECAEIAKAMKPTGWVTQP